MTLSESPAPVVIVPYRPEHREAFERLNRAWLEAYDLLEPADVECLEDPESHVLASGGQVFFALAGGEVVGTCAAIKVSETTWELAKLAVAPRARRQGLGRRLSEAVIQLARQAGAREVFLISNSALVDAIALYESLGFRHTPLPPQCRYRTANVHMTLDLV